MEYHIATPSQLGQILQGCRKQRGLTQAQLGSQIGVIQSAIARAENASERLTAERLLRMLSGLGLELILREKTTAPKADW